VESIPPGDIPGQGGRVWVAMGRMETNQELIGENFLGISGGKEVTEETTSPPQQNRKFRGLRRISCGLFVGRRLLRRLKEEARRRRRK